MAYATPTRRTKTRPNGKTTIRYKAPQKRARRSTRPQDVSFLNFRATPRDRRLIERLARRWTEGNLSEWVRVASTKFKPTRRSFSSAR